MSEGGELERLIRYCRNDGSIAEHLDIPVERVRAARARLVIKERKPRSENYLATRLGERSPNQIGDNEYRSRISKAVWANRAYLKALRAACCNG